MIYFYDFIQGMLYAKLVLKGLMRAFDTFLQFVQKYTKERGLGPQEEKKKQNNYRKETFFKFQFRGKGKTFGIKI